MKDVIPSVRAASSDDAGVIARHIYSLLIELTPANKSTLDLHAVMASTEKVLDQLDRRLWIYLATVAEHQDIGIITVTESLSIYAGGRFGVITELYVEPPYRSASVGEALLQAAQSLALRERWSRVEVGAPSVPRWNRTVEFYKRNGFAEVGPRLCLLTPSND